MKAYSQDLRERVVRAVDRGEQTQEQIAERFGVSTAWIKKLLKRRRETGSIAQKPHGGGRLAVYRGPALARLQRQLAAQPDASLEELRDRTGVKASLMAVLRALARLGVRRKKSPSGRRSKVGRTWSRSERNGPSGLQGLISNVSYSTTKAGPKPT
jgi:transposase